MMTSLADCINTLRIQGINGSFVPQQPLYDLLTPTEIQQELRRHEHPPESLEEHSDILFREGTKIFAILVEINHVGHVADFISRNLLDGKLPFKEQELKEHFKTGLVTLFLRFQWDYLAPVWGDKSSNHKILPSETILPFITEVQISEGSSGKIFAVKLSASHQNVARGASGPEVEITRKELQTNRVMSDPDSVTSTTGKSQALQDFERETRNLRLLSSARNPHIVNIIGSYVLKNVYNILLPRASADLEQLLEGKYPCAPTDESEYFEQFCGLASGLDSMHSLRNAEQGLDMLGCHLDLKPNNILIFDHTWTLADFGLSRLVPVAQGSKTIFKDCIGDYLAPECLADDFSGQRIGRKSDIWSLGCIFCDVLTFIVLGSRGVTDFRTKRRTESHSGVFDSGFHFRGQLKVEVRTWLANLRMSKAIIDLVQHMLHECPDKRPDIRTVWVNLMSLTLNSIANRTKRLLTDVTDQSKSFELRLELMRFEKWCQDLDLVSRSGLQLDSEREQIRDAYPKLLTQIRGIYDRLTEFTSMQNNQDLDTVKDKLYLEIRNHNDCLRAGLPSTLSERIRTPGGPQRLRRVTDAQ